LGSDSADAVLTLVEDIKGDLLKAFDLPIERTFASLQASIVQAFKSEDFLSKCQYLHGETACLICAQKGKYLWWFSVGDCVVYLLNSELVQLGQYALNQRQFFEWIGRVNTFSSPVPSFTVGVRDLRGGPNHILMTTDGLLEFGNRPFEDPRILEEVVSSASSCKTAVQELLERVVEGEGRDSATVISWRYNNTEPITYPSG
jgi:serine/threonine protein phosphatase PrpC